MIELSHSQAEFIRKMVLEIFNQRVENGNVTKQDPEGTVKKILKDGLKQNPDRYIDLNSDVRSIVPEVCPGFKYLNTKNFERFLVVMRESEPVRMKFTPCLMMYILISKHGGEDILIRNLRRESWIKNSFEKHHEDYTILPNWEGEIDLAGNPDAEGIDKKGSLKVIMLHGGEKFCEDIIQGIREKLALDRSIDLYDFNSKIQNSWAFEQLLYGPGSNSIIGVILFYTNRIHKKQWPAQILKDWSWQEEDTPVAYVDVDGVVDETVLGYGKVRREDAEMGVWNLMVQAARRTRRWREKAEETEEINLEIEAENSILKAQLEKAGEKMEEVIQNHKNELKPLVDQLQKLNPELQLVSKKNEKLSDALEQNQLELQSQSLSYQELEKKYLRLKKESMRYFWLTIALVAVLGVVGGIFIKQFL